MQQGYLYLPNFLNKDDILRIEKILLKFHQRWLQKNHQQYLNGAINSAYITHSDSMPSSDRFELFKLISSNEIYQLAKKILGPEFRFLNTQLFFDPHHSTQKNYWHRDIQYTNHSIEKQQQIINEKKSTVIHLRFALKNENGIELIPQSHQRWDSSEELDVRLNLNGKNNWDEISGSQKIPLQSGDLLIFDANIIHRGLYGHNRFAFDLLFCVPDPEILQYRSPLCLPTKHELESLDHSEVFS